MDIKITDVEQDFIDFTVEKTGRSAFDVLAEYTKVKAHFGFDSEKYRQFGLDNYLLGNLFYGEQDESTLIASYQHHALMHLYRFISYSFPKTPVTFRKTRILLQSLRSGDYKKIVTYAKKQLGLLPKHSLEPTSTPELAQYLLAKLGKNPESIVDYGCGPAYTSFEIARVIRDSGSTPPTIVLVDIPSLVSDFVLFRFNKHGLNTKFIPITIDDIYPRLPEHDMCLITEVMEHVKKPLKVFDNINTSLTPEGIIFGNFEDHEPHLLHVSHDLSELRNKLRENGYLKMSEIIYKKLPNKN